MSKAYAGKLPNMAHGFKQWDWVVVKHTPIEGIDATDAMDYKNYVGLEGSLADFGYYNGSVCRIMLNKKSNKAAETDNIIVPIWMLEPYDNAFDLAGEAKDLIPILEDVRDKTNSEKIYIQATALLVRLGKTEYTTETLVRG